jgi:branched-chain amino acid transport system permease protein
MSDIPHAPHVPDARDVPAATGPAVGRDEWVTRHEERRLVRGGKLGAAEQRLRAAPWWAWLLLLLGLVTVLPGLVLGDSGVPFSNGYVQRVGFDTVLYMLLALGLNVVVGWGGLLDLGYVAFYGVGAYAYALLDSDKFDIHLPTIVSIPSIVLLGALVGFLVGLPSRRLVGDYLAIVTLFFLQIFYTVTNNGDHLFGHDLTGGAFGIGSSSLHVDSLSFFGHELPRQKNGVFDPSYYYAALGFFALVYVALRFVNLSRVGRAWRALREDPLAAELMGMPVNWLKLLCFAFGAGVAALSGTLFAALNANVFPLTFTFALLITVYTMVILGGQGSQFGVALGAIIVSVLLEMLREPSRARYLFYVVLALGTVTAFRRSRRLAVVAAATIGFGFAAHAVAGAIDRSWIQGGADAQGADSLSSAISHWVVVPAHVAGWVRPVSYIALIAAVLGLTLVRSLLRVVLLVPTLYLAAFVWENVLLVKPEQTRYIVLGAVLIALMILRPNGLVGERRVEIV